MTGIRFQERTWSFLIFYSSFDIRHRPVALIFFVHNDDDAGPEQPMFGNILQLQIILKQRKAGGAKNAGCIFCEKLFTGCSTAKSWCVTVRPVMGQIKTGVQACVAINKKNDDRHRA
jgi:hypothetical protein